MNLLLVVIDVVVPSIFDVDIVVVVGVVVVIALPYKRSMLESNRR